MGACGTGGLLCLMSGLTLLSLGCAQDEFAGAIVCYECETPALENTTCSQPEGKRDESLLPWAECKRGACMKWTFYKLGVLMLQRTCSEKIELRIALAEVCRTERSGNGYLCMCAGDFCNSATLSGGSAVQLASLTAALIVVFNTRGS